ncbi:MAG: adenylyltransferase/cytidyltransferase family protein [Turicibacter sp.]|nr:adenylyltransferase/cytidyltransferase family protein [Turicibacter sp.]
MQTIGYTAGTFDMFHIGHLNFLENAKGRCDYLIVGVNTDELVAEYKNRAVIVTLSERMRIILALKCVDKVIEVNSLDKKPYLEKLGFNRLFIGSDWAENERWLSTKAEMADFGVETIFLPYTENTSSTLLRKKLLDALPL